MSKTDLTIQLQILTWKTMNILGTFCCHEVGIGSGNDMEIVDFLTYNTKGVWRCYEIKTTISDFHSTAKKTFVGHFNYYVMTKELYEKVKDEIPKEIGVYIPAHAGSSPYGKLYAIKKAYRQKIKVSEDVLIYSLIKSFSREYDKCVKGSKPLEFWTDKQLEEELKRREKKYAKNIFY